MSCSFFKEALEDLAKSGSLADLEKLLWKETGKTLNDIETVTVDLPEMPARAPAFAAAFALIAPLRVSDLPPSARRPDAKRSGFWTLGDGLLMHMPDGKTVVFVHESLAERYLGGYAKDRNAWPMSNSLAKAVEGHSFIVLCNFERVLQAKRTGNLGSLPLLPNVNSAVLIVDVDGKSVGTGLRATFDAERSAHAAHEQFKAGLERTVSLMQRLMRDPDTAKEYADSIAWMNEKQRALSEMKIEVSGSELTATTAYKVDFDLDAAHNSFAQGRLAASKAVSANRLQQLQLALLNYESAYDSVPIIGTGKDKRPIGSDGKALLSWRVAMLPFVEGSGLYSEFNHDEPWNSEHNKKLIGAHAKGIPIVRRVDECGRADLLSDGGWSQRYPSGAEIQRNSRRGHQYYWPCRSRRTGDLDQTGRHLHFRQRDAEGSQEEIWWYVP